MQEVRDWINAELDGGFFHKSSEDTAVSKAYGQIQTWVASQTVDVPAKGNATRTEPKYAAGAINDFQSGADGWLIAYAMVHSCVVVNHERDDAKCRSKVLIPIVARAMNVESINSFEMLERIGAKFSFSAGR